MGNSQKTIYGKLLTAIVLCISITLLFSTLIYYNYYIRVEKNQAFTSDLENLKQTSREIVSLNEISQSISFQIYRNSTIANLLYYREPSVYEVNASMMDLRNYLNSLPFIDSIYVYNSTNRNFYVVSKTDEDGTFLSEELGDQDIVLRLNENKTLKPFVPIPRVLGEKNGMDSPTSVYTFFAFDAINPKKSIESAVIINISASWVNKEFSVSTDHSQSYILDDRGRLLSGTTLTEAELSVEDRNKIVSHLSDGNQGYFTDKISGRTSLISYTVKDSLGWQYIRVTSYEHIVANTRSIRNTTLIFAGLTLLIGLFVSALLSKRLYRPIGKIVDEVTLLQSEKRDNMLTLRQNALRSLILTENNGLSLRKKEKLNQLGIAASFENGYRIAVLRINNYQELLAERGTSIASYRFAVINIISEICGQAYQVEGIDMNDDSVVFLFITRLDELSSSNESFHTLLVQSQEACLEYLKIGVSGAYGPLSMDESLLRAHYQEIREASFYRFHKGHGSLLLSSSLAVSKPETYLYPAELEKKLTDSLAAGKAAEAAGYWYGIVNETEHYPYQISRLALSRLAVTIKSVSEQISKHSALSLEGLSELPEVSEYETLEELHYAYVEWFEEFAERLANKRSGKQNDLVRLINEKIARSYTDPNLNLNQIADELHLSPVHISRVYKQHTSAGIMDVVMQTRMQEVCRLLTETTLSVSAIGEQTGFTSTSYLHRMFKKNFNVTPIEYRRASKL